MYHIFICDDQIAHIKNLSDIVSKTLDADYKVKISEFDNTASLKEAIENNSCDILFLDIVMNDDNGIDIGKYICTNHPQIQIVFVTAYLDYASEIFEANPIYFLKKPLEPDKVAKALKRAIDEADKVRNDSIVLREKNDVLRISQKKIKYIESEKRFAYVMTEESKIQVYESLNQLINILPPNFLRCHKSFIVNMDMVKRLDKEVSAFILITEEKIPVSPRKFTELRNAFFEYVHDKSLV